MEGESFGFIGVGRMGSPMATRLLDAGRRLWVFDRDERAIERLVSRGARPARSASEVASEAETVFLSLPTPDIVRDVALGAGGVAEGTKVKRVVDFSTTGPRVAVAVAKALAERGMTYVDAPVSGGIAGARNGTLAVMVSCPKAVFGEIEPVLKTFGKVFFVGEGAGQGQTMKLANNLLAAAAIAVSSEAIVMGVKAGLDPKMMLEVLNVSTGRNTATLDKFPRSVLPRTFDFGFATGLSYKDVRLCVDEAEALGVPMIVGSAVRQFLAVTNARFGPDSDFTSMVRVVEEWAGVEVRG